MDEFTLEPSLKRRKVKENLFWLDPLRACGHAVQFHGETPSREERYKLYWKAAVVLCHALRQRYLSRRGALILRVVFREDLLDESDVFEQSSVLCNLECLTFGLPLWLLSAPLGFLAQTELVPYLEQNTSLSGDTIFRAITNWLLRSPVNITNVYGHVPELRHFKYAGHENNQFVEFANIVPWDRVYKLMVRRSCSDPQHAIELRILLEQYVIKAIAGVVIAFTTDTQLGFFH